jgi:hypothetical protein
MAATKVQEGVAEFAALVAETGFTVTIRKAGGSEYLVTVQTTFTPDDVAAYCTAESDAAQLLAYAPMLYPGSVWGTDGATVGGHAGLTGGYMRLNKSGVGARWAKAAAKAVGAPIGGGFQ